MTDYFTRLAETLVGAGPTIRPLLTSPAQSMAAGLMPENEVSLSARVSETEGVVPAEAASQPSRTAELSDGELPQRTAPAEVSKTFRSRTRDLHSRVQPISREEPLSQSDLPDQASASPFISPPNIGSVKTLAAPRELLDESPPEGPTPSRPSEIRSGVRESPSSPAKATRPNAQSANIFAENNNREPALEKSVAQNTPVRDTSAPLAAERPSMTRPTTTSHHEPRTRPADNRNPDFPFAFTLPDDNSEKEAPVVRVTIGRIEVRAITPAPPKRQPPAPAAPKLSLDEFLRQHNGRQP